MRPVPSRSRLVAWKTGIAVGVSNIKLSKSRLS
jgi:hypothetical protein